MVKQSQHLQQSQKTKQNDKEEDMLKASSLSIVFYFLFSRYVLESECKCEYNSNIHFVKIQKFWTNSLLECLLCWMMCAFPSEYLHILVHVYQTHKHSEYLNHLRVFWVLFFFCSSSSFRLFCCVAQIFQFFKEPKLWIYFTWDMRQALLSDSMLQAILLLKSVNEKLPSAAKRQVNTSKLGQHLKFMIL